MDPLVKKVAERAKSGASEATAATGSLSRDPARLMTQMKGAVEALLSARVEMRQVWEALGDIKRDASGVFWTDNYNDPEIERAYKLLYDLDHEIGQGFRVIEFMMRKLPPKVVK